jgi:hypothetical protein
MRDRDDRLKAASVRQSGCHGIEAQVFDDHADGADVVTAILGRASELAADPGSRDDLRG